MNPKQRAAEAAISFLRDDMVVGLGTGSTADFFLQALAASLRDGRLHGIRGIATSRQSERRAGELGIPLAILREDCTPDITVDGADEIGPGLQLIKGLGGAMLREKMVAQHSGQVIIIADAAKRVEMLGTRSPLPVEVVSFGHEIHLPFFRRLGAEPTLRRNPDGSIFQTDNGNYIFDCRFPGIPDPDAIENAILHEAGIVDCGLFLGVADVALIADATGITRIPAQVLSGS
jgi:ribose 5-phosphate isomerase A